MYLLPYGSNDVEPRHYKLEWLSLLGAVAAALVLLMVAYFINNQKGLQRVAFICIVVAGFTVALCLAALFAHYYVARKCPKADRDPPPSYKDAWRKDFYSRRSSENQNPEHHVSGASSTLLPHSDSRLQCGSSHNESGLSVGSSAHTSDCNHPSTSSSSHNQPITCSAAICSHYYVDESQEVGSNALPSYDEAMQSMDLSSLEKLRQDIEV